MDDIYIAKGMVIIWYKRKRDGDIEFIELMNSMEFNGIQFLSEIHCYWIENFFFFFFLNDRYLINKNESVTSRSSSAKPS